MFAALDLEKLIPCFIQLDSTRKYDDQLLQINKITEWPSDKDLPIFVQEKLNQLEAKRQLDDSVRFSILLDQAPRLTML